MLLHKKKMQDNQPKLPPRGFFSQRYQAGKRDYERLTDAFASTSARRGLWHFSVTAVHNASVPAATGVLVLKILMSSHLELNISERLAWCGPPASSMTHGFEFLCDS